MKITQQKPNRIFRMKQLASSCTYQGLFPVSASTIWRWIKYRDFPKGHKIGEKTTIWYEHEILDWLNKHSERIQIEPDATK